MMTSQKNGIKDGLRLVEIQMDLFNDFGVELIMKNCEFIKAAIDKVACNNYSKVKLLEGFATDHEAEMIIFTASDLAKEKAKASKKKRSTLIWCYEEI